MEVIRMKINPLALLPLLLLPLMAGCAAPPQELPTATASPSPLPSPTVVWFPPTPTHTPFPTAVITPTPQMLTGIGALAVQDDFSDPSLWQSLKRPSGQVVISSPELAISLSGPNGYLFSQRNNPVLSDFYLEATLKTSLCNGGDAFGLLLRTSTFQDYYRWQINCDGYQRVERVRGGSVSVLQDWSPSPQVLPGAPQTFKLGMIASGNELRFFVDDTYQFSVFDDAFQNGGVGFFARSTGETPVSAGIRDLKVYNLSGSLPIPTPRSGLPAQSTPSVTPAK
jgi:hypothetical protein